MKMNNTNKTEEIPREEINYNLYLEEDFFDDDENESNSKSSIFQSMMAFIGFIMALGLGTYMIKIFLIAYFNGGIVLVDINRFNEGTLEFFIIILATIFMYSGFGCLLKKNVA